MAKSIGNVEPRKFWIVCSSKWRRFEEMQFPREYFQATRTNHKHTSRKLRPTSINQCSTNWKTWYRERSHRSITIRSIAKGISDLCVETSSYYGNIFKMSCFLATSFEIITSCLTWKFYFKILFNFYSIYIL